VATAGAGGAALAPAPGKCEPAELCPIAADAEDRDGKFTHHVAWAAFGRNPLGGPQGLLIQQRGKLTAVNMDTRAVLWSQEEPQKFSYSSESAATPWPIVAGGRAFVRLQTKREPYLACYDLKDGKCLWRERYDEGVLSDPILVNNWLYVLSYRTAMGGQATICLRRVSPETGQSALSARLVVLRREARLLDPGRLLLAGDSLLFRCAGALVCCDLLGEVQWIRRLTFVPPEVDRGLMNDLLPGPMVLRESNVILAAPACPSVQCVDTRTGRMVWSYLQPQLRRVVGLAGPAVVLATDGYLEALDAETGKLLWRAPIEADAEAVLPAEGGTVLCVTMDEPAADKKTPARGIRRARWLSGKDGTTVRTETLDGAQASRSLTDATALYATGKELIGLANYDPKKRTAKVFTMKVK
jgi:outer membrane protein assembly factor BamB